MPRRGNRSISRMHARAITEEMSLAGYTAKAIAIRLNVDERTVKEYRAANRDTPLPDRTGNAMRAGTTPEIQFPVAFEDLEPEVQWCLEDSPEGFRRFNDRFWPDEPMPPHILSFARAAYNYVGVCSRWKESDGTLDGGTGRGKASDGPALRRCGEAAAYEASRGGQLLCDGCVRGYQALGGRATLKGTWKKRVVLNVPPGHAKTTYFTVRMASWRICRNRSWRIIVMSETDVIASTMVGDIASELEDPEGLAATFGPFKGEREWSPAKSRFRVLGSEAPKKDATVFGRGVTTQINGLRADEIMCDDLVSRDSCKTPDRRRDAEEQYSATVVSRLTPGGIVRVIGTRWHMDDLYATLASKKRSRLRTEDPVYEHVNFPAVLDWDTQEVLWPTFWSYERLMSEKFDEFSDPRQFELVYQQNPLPLGSTLVEYQWIYGNDDDPARGRGCLDRDRPAGPQPLEPGWVRIISVDPSQTGYWGVIVMDVAEQNSSNPLYAARVLEVARSKMDVRRFMDLMSGLLPVYQPRYVVAEYNMWRGWLENDLQWKDLAKSYGVLVKGHTTHRNKADPALGVESLASDFMHGRIRLPYSGAEAVKQSKWLIEEVLNYPYYTTDDVLMALWFPKPNLMSLRNRAPSLAQPRSGFHTPARLSNVRWTRRDDERMPA